MDDRKRSEETVPETAEAPVDTEVSAESEKKKPKKKEKELTEKIEALEKTIAEKDDKYLRLAAEYDNFRRRSSQERTAVYGEALCDAVKNLLPILDDLERAAAYSGAEEVAEGLKIVSRSAETALEKLGVTAFGESGDAFDANLHNAVMHVDDESLGEGVITDVFQKGYKKGDKIIRYAMVKVAN